MRRLSIPLDAKYKREHDADRQHLAMCADQHVMNFARDRAGHFFRPGFEHEIGGFVGQILRPDHASECRQYEKEREHRHQARERDMARDRPAIVGVELPEGIETDAPYFLQQEQTGFPRGAEPVTAR